MQIYLTGADLELSPAFWKMGYVARQAVWIVCMFGARWAAHLYWEARLCGEAELLLEVHQPGGGVVHHILMPHADTLLPRLHPHMTQHQDACYALLGMVSCLQFALEINCCFMHAGPLLDSRLCRGPCLVPAFDRAGPCQNRKQAMPSQVAGGEGTGPRLADL